MYRRPHSPRIAPADGRPSHRTPPRLNQSRTTPRRTSNEAHLRRIHQDRLVPHHRGRERTHARRTHRRRGRVHVHQQRRPEDGRDQQQGEERRHHHRVHVRNPRQLRKRTHPHVL